MKIIVSAEAGLLGILGSKPELISMDGEVMPVATDTDVISAFRTCDDRQELDVRTRELATETCLRGWRVDRAARLTWMLFEETLQPDQMKAAASALDAILGKLEFEGFDFAEVLHTGHLFNPPAGRLRALREYPFVTKLLRDLATAKSVHETVVQTEVILPDPPAPPPMARERVSGGVTGTVKWFSGTKGFGFIQPDGGGNDVFIHISAVERAGLGALHEGQKIRYRLEKDSRGKLAALPVDVAAKPS